MVFVGGRDGDKDGAMAIGGDLHESTLRFQLELSAGREVEIAFFYVCLMYPLVR